MNQHIPTVLVIDDDPLARETIEALIASDELHIVFAVDGKSGIEKAKTILPDAIILDVMMPGMDGYEVCKILRADPGLSEVHIIMLTALDDRTARLTGLSAGVDDFISKPFDGFELHLRLKTIFQLNRYRQLNTERARFSWLVENNEDGYLTIDANGVIQYANLSAQNFLHLPPDFMNIDFSSHVMKYYQPHPVETWENWPKNLHSCYLVHPETRNSRAFWLVLDTIDTPYEQENNRVIRVRDVTEKFSISQDIRKFHLVVNHKMRTPVAHLVSSMNLIESKIEKLSGEEVKDLILIAMKGVDRLAKEVRDVLAYMDAPLAMESGVPLELRNLFAIVQTAEAQNNIDAIQLTISPLLSNTTLAITTHAMELILDELFENSKKFHPEGSPKIEIKVTPSEEKGQVCISVLDDGIELTAEQLSWAHMPYYQGEKFFTGETPGMGLGIPLIATLIWQAGGGMRLSNRSDQAGVLVTLNIPVLTETTQVANIDPAEKAI